MKKKDAVNHPDHYVTGKYECVKVMEEVFGKAALIGYFRLNVFKYIWRSGKKGSELADLKKAQVYLGWLIEKTEEAQKPAKKRTFASIFKKKEVPVVEAPLVQKVRKPRISVKKADTFVMPPMELNLPAVKKPRVQKPKAPPAQPATPKKREPLLKKAQ